MPQNNVTWTEDADGAWTCSGITDYFKWPYTRCNIKWQGSVDAPTTFVYCPRCGGNIQKFVRYKEKKT